VDLAHNNVGGGALLVFTQLCDKLAQARVGNDCQAMMRVLGCSALLHEEPTLQHSTQLTGRSTRFGCLSIFSQVAAQSIRKGQYTLAWDADVVAGAVDIAAWYELDPHRPISPVHARASRSTSPSHLSEDARLAAVRDQAQGSNGSDGARATSACLGLLGAPTPGKAAVLGRQLYQGPLRIDLGGNPLGWSGTRQVRLELMKVVKCIRSHNSVRQLLGRGGEQLGVSGCGLLQMQHRLFITGGTV
jgi:hypothetical protein